MGKIWFVGAGPGHVDLITVQGRSLIQQAGAILYAGSLVDASHLTFAPPGCHMADSSGMTLPEMVTWLLEHARQCQTVVRLQTGDPSLYGALTELMLPLRQAGVEIHVVPGVSSALAAAAAARQPLTLPEVTQTVIFTRTGGRTAAPAAEQLRHLAGHGATLCIFLSATLGEEVHRELTAAGWPATAPILLVHRVSYPDQRLVTTTLGELAATLKQQRMTGQTMIIAGPALAAHQQGGVAPSRLYDPEFSHGCRRKKTLHPDHKETQP